MQFIPFDLYVYRANLVGVALLPISVIAAIIVLTLHQFATAYIAVRCGDLTPKINGRLTINPLRHFDMIGLILFAFTGFGWSRHLPINPNNFKKLKTGLILTSIAGIVFHILTAFMLFPLYFLTTNLLPINFFSVQLSGLLWFLIVYSVAFAVFNLIPLPPLAGWRLIDILAKKRGKIFQFIKYNGTTILYCLIGYHFIISTLLQYNLKIGLYLSYFDVLGYIRNMLVNGILYPIQKLWGLVFSLWR